MTFTRLEELAKENALEGKHIGCRIHMSAELSVRLMQRYKPDLGNEDLTRLRDVIFGAPLLYQLMGVPIINDVGMVDDPTLWILVDPTGEEIERGNVEPAHEEDKCRAGYKDCQCSCFSCARSHTKRIVNNANATQSSADKASGTATE